MGGAKEFENTDDMDDLLEYKLAKLIREMENINRPITIDKMNIK